MKGAAEAVQAAGIARFRADMAAAAPILARHVGAFGGREEAVSAAHILSAPLAGRADPDPLLHKVQQRRMLPVKVVQAVQGIVHRNVIGAVMRNQQPKVPAIVCLWQFFPPLQALPARLVGLGIGREHVRSPNFPAKGSTPREDKEMEHD